MTALHMALIISATIITGIILAMSFTGIWGGKV